MILTVPQPLIEWTNVAWPELLKIGGLGNIKFKVVDKLPFNSKAHAMTWKQEVLIRREWIQPALNDLAGNSEINIRHMWCLNVLAWHEPIHVLEQRRRPWFLYLLRYVWQWFKDGRDYRKIDEEEKAYDHQDKLLQRWKDNPPINSPDWIWKRPN